MKKASLVHAKAHLSELVDAAEHRGQRVLILRHGKPAAAIVPVAVAERGAAKRTPMTSAEAEALLHDLEKSARPSSLSSGEALGRERLDQVRLVLDASVAIAALRPHEPAYAAARGRILRLLSRTDTAVLPALFIVEVRGALARLGFERKTSERLVDVLSDEPHEVVTLGPTQNKEGGAPGKRHPRPHPLLTACGWSPPEPMPPRCSALREQLGELLPERSH